MIDTSIMEIVNGDRIDSRDHSSENEKCRYHMLSRDQLYENLWVVSDDSVCSLGTLAHKVM